MGSDNKFRPYIGIHNLFEQKVRDRPNDIAVKISGNSVSYHQLNVRANYLADYLLSIGVRERNVVAISMERSFELIVSLLAILKCGAAYLPLDANNPAARTSACLESADVRIIISDICGVSCFSGRTVISTAEQHLFNSSLQEFNSYQSAPSDKAYVMFTSGSTGKPKGVVVPHRAVVRLVIDTNYIQISSKDRVLQLASISFDASTFEIWGALLNSATLVLYSGSVLDPNLLKKEIVDNRITILWLTAALFHLLISNILDALVSVRVLLAGGDVLNPKYIRQVLEALPSITLINGYGPTENTTFTCCHVMTPDNIPSSTVPIGKPISGTEVHILNDSLCPVEKGQEGDLYVSGEGVALGYLNNDEQPPPFFINESIASGLIYQTGDIVQINDNGDMEFIGRKDNQVKIRGYRISLEEVRVNIVELEAVRDALVILKKFESGDQLLIAYIQFQPRHSIQIVDIERQLSVKIPKYMIPNKFIVSDGFPMTDGGKIDSNAIELHGEHSDREYMNSKEDTNRDRR